MGGNLNSIAKNWKQQKKTWVVVFEEAMAVRSYKVLAVYQNDI